SVLSLALTNHKRVKRESDSEDREGLKLPDTSSSAPSPVQAPLPSLSSLPSPEEPVAPETMPCDEKIMSQDCHGQCGFEYFPSSQTQATPSKEGVSALELLSLPPSAKGLPSMAAIHTPFRLYEHAVPPLSTEASIPQRGQKQGHHQGQHEQALETSQEHIAEQGRSAEVENPSISGGLDMRRGKSNPLSISTPLGGQGPGLGLGFTARSERRGVGGRGGAAVPNPYEKNRAPGSALRGPNPYQQQQQSATALHDLRLHGPPRVISSSAASNLGHACLNEKEKEKENSSEGTGRVLDQPLNQPLNQLLNQPNASPSLTGVVAGTRRKCVTPPASATPPHNPNPNPKEGRLPLSEGDGTRVGVKIRGNVTRVGVGGGDEGCGGGATKGIGAASVREMEVQQSSDGGLNIVRMNGRDGNHITGLGSRGLMGKASPGLTSLGQMGCTGAEEPTPALNL
ncbi:unnamed protein product, partial [Discosporangium mesarthrocarpum]